MSMYVVQVKPGTDLQAAVLLRKRGHLVRCPQRTMDIRKEREMEQYHRTCLSRLSVSGGRNRPAEV